MGYSMGRWMWMIEMDMVLNTTLTFAAEAAALAKMKGHRKRGVGRNCERPNKSLPPTDNSLMRLRLEWIYAHRH